MQDLWNPDPDNPFIVQFNASTSGVGAILSQQEGKLPQLYPCVFISKKLNLAEQYYDIGGKEALPWTPDKTGEPYCWLDLIELFPIVRNLEYEGQLSMQSSGPWMTESAKPVPLI